MRWNGDCFTRRVQCETCEMHGLSRCLSERGVGMKGGREVTCVGVGTKWCVWVTRIGAMRRNVVLGHVGENKRVYLESGLGKRFRCHGQIGEVNDASCYIRNQPRLHFPVSVVKGGAGGFLHLWELYLQVKRGL